MSWFKKQTEEPVDYKYFVIDRLRGLAKKDYDKIIKTVEIYREADESVGIVEAGSKRAFMESRKEDGEIESLENEIFDELETKK
jgi:hypothetical protein